MSCWVLGMGGWVGRKRYCLLGAWVGGWVGEGTWLAGGEGRHATWRRRRTPSRYLGSRRLGFGAGRGDCFGEWVGGWVGWVGGGGKEAGRVERWVGGWVGKGREETYLHSCRSRG